MNEEKCTIRVRRLSNRSPDNDLANTTVAQRMGMVWQLTLDGWGFMGEEVPEL